MHCYVTQILKHRLTKVFIMALKFQFSCLTLQSNRDNTAKSPGVPRCLSPKESINFIIHVEDTLKCLIKAATNLSNPAQTTINWELWSCIDSLLHRKANVRILTCWHLHSHLSQHKYIGIFQKKKKRIRYFLLLIGFWFCSCLMTVLVFEMAQQSSKSCLSASQIQRLEVGTTTMSRLEFQLAWTNLWGWICFFFFSIGRSFSSNTLITIPTGLNAECDSFITELI